MSEFPKQNYKLQSLNHGNITEKKLIIAMNGALEESVERYRPRKVTFMVSRCHHSDLTYIRRK